MNRIQKKCLVASTLMHGLLLLVMVVGTAFLNSNQKPVESPHIITLRNFTVTDGQTRGESPAAVAAAPAPVSEKPTPAPAEPVQSKPAPREREPEPPKPVVEPPKTKPVERKETVSEIPVQKPLKRTLPKPEPVPKTTAKSSTKPVPVKREIDLGKPVMRNPKEKQAAAEASAQAAEKAEQQRANAQRVAAINGSLKNLGNNLSTSTTVEMPEGLGGAAEINYRDLVLKKYDDAWNAPGDVDDDEANTKARVVIARSGNVISADIIQNSRNPKLDKSVRRALDSLRFIHPFPAGSPDSQRTYIINFNLKAKRGTG